MFVSFPSQEKRREWNGSDFLEIQFCRMPPRTKIETIVAVDSVTHWLDDSLYVSGDDANLFVEEYGGIFDCGTYNNLKTGAVDPCGINYYRPEQIEAITAGLLAEKPAGYEKLLKWLKPWKNYNGLYILGE